MILVTLIANKHLYKCISPAAAVGLAAATNATFTILCSSPRTIVATFALYVCHILQEWAPNRPRVC